MINRIVISVFVFFMALGSVQADYRIEDPKKILEQSDRFLGSVSFEKTFQLHDQARYQKNECTMECDASGSCKEVCKEPLMSEHKVLVVKPDAITIEIVSGDGKVEHMPIQKNEYELHRGNFLRYLLAKLNQQMLQTILQRDSEDEYVRLDDAKFVDYVLENKSIIKGMRVFVTIHAKDPESGDTFDIPLSITIGKDVPGVAQQLSFHFFPGFTISPALQLLSYTKP